MKWIQYTNENCISLKSIKSKVELPFETVGVYNNNKCEKCLLIV